MSWKDKVKEFGGGDLVFLSEDGETITFIVVGEPILIKGKFKGNPTEKVGCPVVTEDGFQLFVVGKRLFRRIAKREDGFNKDAYTAIRHGMKDDSLTSYELRVVEDKAVADELRKIKAKEFKASMIPEAVKAAEEAMKQ